ncbi:hypothetical protein GCM10022248_66480 [Nonomuraea soli]
MGLAVPPEPPHAAVARATALITPSNRARIANSHLSYAWIPVSVDPGAFLCIVRSAKATKYRGISRQLLVETDRPHQPEWVK